jgi:group I intron endonuclease
MKRTSYIYILRDPKTKVIRYCGQSLVSIDRRLTRHIKETSKKTGRLTKKEAWIRSLQGVRPIVEEVEKCDYELADEREVYHIKRLKAENHPLTNGTNGGKGRVFSGANHPNFGKTMSDSTRKKIGEKNAGKNNGMFGKSITWTDERRLKMIASLAVSKAMVRRNADPEWRAKISKSQREKMLPVEVTSVETGEVLFTFVNHIEAAEYLGCSECNIVHAIKDKRQIGKKMKSLNERCFVSYKV